MDPEFVLNLFDSNWFFNKIQSQTSISSTLEPKNPNPQNQQNSPRPNFSKQLTLHKRSKSDQLVINTNPTKDFNSSPNSRPHLQTINSDKEFTFETQKIPEYDKRYYNKREKRQLSKSLSELEFEELKGFMDLGFVFSEEDKDSSLVEIIPGLHRMGSDEIVGPKERPYLSEAWDMRGEEVGPLSPLRNWRIPEVSNEVDMKDSLKWWAHTVASAVR